ncbi:MAG: CDP-diacylglycerol--glycerol-3-phosphate 3-phosphatidyltransferase [candidate division Zixibacteria bacterium]|nr:CDP-diacylglycerol--glycerol-3-phosphate 3-phosphatidyltransferase [candidate division Zixibacteria bacterium]
MVISPIIFWAIKDDNIALIVCLVVWALISDFLDGFLARRLNSITKAGKIIDPLADKLCVASAAFAVSLYGDMPVSLVIIIIARDLTIAVFGFAIIKKVKEIPVSNIIGKLTVTVLSLALIIYVFKAHQLYAFAFWSSVFFIVASSVSYLFIGIRAISYKKENNI